MPDASPTKWHLAHTSWFFETVVLAAHVPGYRPFDPAFAHLFNSYYESLGPRHPRPQRGCSRGRRWTRCTLPRPCRRGHAGVHRGCRRRCLGGAAPLVELGLQHEQQHQELIATDILHAFSCNPLLPAWRPQDAPALRLASQAPALRWLAHPGGTVDIGHAGEGFAFDNETPRHAVLLQPFELADRLVTCGEYLPRSSRTAATPPPGCGCPTAGPPCRRRAGTRPPYWIAPGDARAPADQWQVFGPAGVRPLDPAAPVTQLSFYEAAAYAEWAGARLPTEAEWEAMWDAPGITQMTGHAWQWTRSSYDPYPGFRPLAGAVGEYNGKFMVGQLVLRGGSAFTPPGHARRSYRNFFPPARAGSSRGCGSRARWHVERPRLDDIAQAAAQRNRATTSCATCNAPWPAAARHLAQVLLRRRRLAPVRPHLRPARVLPDAHRARAAAEHAGAIAQVAGTGADLVEFGAGSCSKVRLLLPALQPRRYLPIDISTEHLVDAAVGAAARASRPARAAGGRPTTRRLRLPDRCRGAPHRLLPRLDHRQLHAGRSAAFLRGAARLLRGGGLLLGADLVKDPPCCTRPTTTPQGVTAAFNLNLLARANRELGTDFDLDAFWHSAFYNAAQQRIEMHLVSRVRQQVSVGGRALPARRRPGAAHRELVQVQHRRPAPPGHPGRLPPRPGVDRSRQPVQRALAARA
jgi:ergothioneine biosynthesis protein EgtB